MTGRKILRSNVARVKLGFTDGREGFKMLFSVFCSIDLSKSRQFLYMRAWKCYFFVYCSTNLFKSLAGSSMLCLCDGTSARLKLGFTDGREGFKIIFSVFCSIDLCKVSPVLIHDGFEMLPSFLIP